MSQVRDYLLLLNMFDNQVFQQGPQKDRPWIGSSTLKDTQLWQLHLFFQAFFFLLKIYMAQQLKSQRTRGCANFVFQVCLFIFLVLQNAKTNCIYMLWRNNIQCQHSIINRKRVVGAVLLEKLTSAEFLNKVLHETAVMGGPRAWGAWPWDSWSLEWV